MNNYQDQILQILTRNQRITVSQLSELLDVSNSTVRRQLIILEKKGLLLRTHGGAQLPSPLFYEPPYEERSANMVDAKRNIALLGRTLIDTQRVIGISGGTTCTELAKQLRTLHGATIVTNAINIALELQSQKENRVVVTGGTLNSFSYELVGHLVSHSLETIHMDIVFLGVSGIDVQFGFSMSDEPEAVAGRAFMKSSEKTVIVADHTKLQKSTFAHLCHINAVDILITDAGITQEQLTQLSQAGLNILVASHMSD